MSQILFLRGPSARLSQITPANGEPVWVQDTKEFRVGDGSTVGGVPLNFVIPEGTQVDGDVAIWNSGQLASIPKATYLDGYATETFVNDGLATKLGVNDNAVSATTAGDATNLNGQPATYYLNTTQRSNSVISTSETNVASSLAVKTAYDKGQQGISDANTAYVTATNAYSKAETAQSTADGKIAANNYAQSTIGGTLKARLSGDTLYLTNNGTNA